MGITTKHVPALAAKIGMIVGILFYSFFTFVNIKDVIPFFANTDGDLHWLHGYFISFLASIGIMLIIGYLAPKTKEEIAVSEEKTPAPVDMTPWPMAKKVSVGIFGATVAIYLVLTWAAG